MHDIPEAVGMTRLLAEHGGGDDEALNAIFALCYDELRMMARRHLPGGREALTLDTTALVHEAYLNLSARRNAQWPDRAHFFGFTSKVMRHILVDHARSHAAQKRSAGRIRVTLTDETAMVEQESVEILALEEALTRLGERSPRLADVVECRYFGGLSAEETAETLGISLRTVERDWSRARAYLYQLLQTGAGDERLNQAG
jgi:RNA polymerase sigma factor (TIGR02999 family)